MTIAITPFQPHVLRPRPLATCLTAALFAAVSLPSSAQTTNDTSWIRLRTDPTQRIFPQLPFARGSAPAPGATVAVANCNDDGPGSLRIAVRDAGDGDTIDLTALTCSTITLQTGAIQVPVDNLTVIGRSRAALAIDGNDADRVFIHPYGGALTLRAMTIRGGRDRTTGFHVAGGGCVASAGYLTIDDAVVTGCYAGGEGAYGGAVYAYSLTLSHSTLSGNVANGVHEAAGTAAFGGAAFVYTLQFADSTVSGNRAVHHSNASFSSYDIGGGIVSVHGGSIVDSTIDSNYSQGRGGGLASFDDVVVSNSTFSGNVAATAMGGGLFLRQPSTMQIGNSTLTGNHAGSGGGGIWLAATTSTMQSSIVAGNSAGVGQIAELQDAAELTLNGANNLIGASSPSITLPADTLDADPRLAPLEHVGGPTRTHALLPGSPAIDAGNNLAGLAFDQRGDAYPRVYGASADIGAFEQQAPRPGFVQTSVPTLSMWSLGLLVACLGGLGIVRRQMGQNSRRAPNCS